MIDNHAFPWSPSPSLGSVEYSAAREVDTKVANLLLKVAQNVANLKNQFKTGCQQVPKSYILEVKLELSSDLFKAGFKQVLNQF